MSAKASYRTSEVAKIIGIHPNTVRFYEEWGLISKPEREKNGYRVFTDLHIYEIRLARTAFAVEILQNGLRRKLILMAKTAAKRDFDGALALAREYLDNIRLERENATEAIRIARELIDGKAASDEEAMKRNEAAQYLGVTIDTLRNWELNGLIDIKRSKNGYRVYSSEDIRRLKLIRTLRCANYSLSSILRMINKLNSDPSADIEAALNTPEEDEDIISACDKLIISLDTAEKNAHEMILLIAEMKKL